MFNIKDLDARRRQQLIDSVQVFEAYEDRRKEFVSRYGGSMRWAARDGAEYLLRKRGRVEKSLGRRSPETEQAYHRFTEGRDRAKHELEVLAAKLEEMAPVNRAMGLGRVPAITARILRKLSEAGLLGEHLHVVGANALFAYEAATGVFFSEGTSAFFATGLLATGDADLLLDARRRLRLALSDIRREGVLGLLRQVDHSFAPRIRADFRAVNRDGYYVDLIRPEDNRVMSAEPPDRIGGEGDLRGAPIHGLAWLINSPKFSAVAVDERGYPLRIDAVDPRAFALHKMWIATRPDREPLKKARDLEQAYAVAALATRYLRLSFDDPVLSALPAELREHASELLKADAASQPLRGNKGDIPEPGW